MENIRIWIKSKKVRAILEYKVKSLPKALIKSFSNIDCLPLMLTEPPRKAYWNVIYSFIKVVSSSKMTQLNK